MDALRHTYFGYDRNHGYIRATVTEVPMVAVDTFAARFTYCTPGDNFSLSAQFQSD